MPTITDRAALVGAGVAALSAWFFALAFLTYASEPSWEVIAWVPQARVATTLSRAPVRALDAPAGGFLRLRGDAPGFVAGLYASGAWIVLPAGRAGCGLTPTTSLKATSLR
jgi:hypothetical protein